MGKPVNRADRFLRPVGDEQPEPYLPRVSRQHRRWQGNELRQYEQEEAHRAEGQRQNSQCASRIKDAVVVAAAAGIEQNGGDEEAGKHEEQLDAKPAHVREQCRDFQDAVGRLVHLNVVRDDQQDRERAQPVERRPALVLGHRDCLRRRSTHRT